VDIDREKARSLGLLISEITNAMQMAAEIAEDAVRLAYLELLAAVGRFSWVRPAAPRVCPPPNLRADGALSLFSSHLQQRPAQVYSLSR
jgi:hypothetical protein